MAVAALIGLGRLFGNLWRRGGRGSSDGSGGGDFSVGDSDGGGD